MQPKSIIVLFVMPGCHACEEFKPRFERMVKGFQSYGQPLVWHSNGRDPKPGTIPIVVLDATSEDPSVVGLADSYKVEGMPTTILLTHNAKPQVLLGGIDDVELHALLTSACLANR
jgi:thioredoxin-related protein